MADYLDLAGIATALGVRQATVYQWRWRYRDREPRFPSPDITLGGKEGWKPDRLDEIRDWLAQRPGRGAGGGRPRTRT